MIQPFPGVDDKGFRDPQSNCLMTFADATARDAWVTSIGGTGALKATFACFLTATNALSIWNGSAWRTIATT